MRVLSESLAVPAAILAMHLAVGGGKTGRGLSRLHIAASAKIEGGRKGGRDTGVSLRLYFRSLAVARFCN